MGFGKKYYTGLEATGLRYFLEEGESVLSKSTVLFGDLNTFKLKAEIQRIFGHHK